MESIGKMNQEIDFVLAWVDGNDPDFQAARRAYSKAADRADKEANGDCRYRSEPEMLRYWFRSVERCSPWVRKIHFVTCGQKPDWLDEHHPKLNLVNHQDFIPPQYLPTFCARTIELNFHRIEGLAEQYVYFNDDMYLLQPVPPTFFFRDGNPVLVTDLRIPHSLNATNWCRTLFNDYCVVNRHFNAREAIWENRGKWFNLKELGFKRTRQNLSSYLVNKHLLVNNYAHLALPHLKSTLEEIWEQAGDILDTTCLHRFRSDDQVNQWLCCAWNQARGRFYPGHEDKMGVRIVLTPKFVIRACDLIRNRAVS